LAHDVNARAVMRSDWPAIVARTRRPLNALLRTRLIASLATPHDVDEYLEWLAPAWSVRDIRARILEVRRETADAVSLLLRPNEHWHSHRAGQFVQLAVRIEGIRHTRCFSLSSAPADDSPLRLTIRTVRGGLVSGWAANLARCGDVVTLSPAQGTFVLPEPIPPKLLFISGGSGITPLISMLRHLALTAYRGDVVFLHYAKREVIFARELADLSKAYDGLRTHLFLTREPGGVRRTGNHFSRDALEMLAPDWRERETFLCGPVSLSEAVLDLWNGCGLSGRLQVEHFAPPSRAMHAGNHGQCRLVFRRSGQEVPGRTDASLLEQAESAGLSPRFGCRRGICYTCTRRKLTGTVRNELTGALSTEPNALIQLCISTPQSDVTLDL
jgi:ferredoxin-NADP reductase